MEIGLDPARMTLASPGKVLVSDSQLKRYGEQFFKRINGSDNTEIIVIADEVFSKMTLKEKMALLA